MSCERSAGSLAETGNDVQHTFGESSFLCKFSQPDGRERCLLGGLQNDGAAGRECRTELPGRHQEREVPWDDLPYYADRLTMGISQVLCSWRVRDADRNGATFNLR